MRRRFAKGEVDVRLGLGALDQPRQTGDFARSGFAMVNTLFGGFIDRRLGQLQLVRCLGRIFAGRRGAHGLDEAFNLGAHGTVAQTPDFILQSTFFR